MGRSEINTDTGSKTTIIRGSTHTTTIIVDFDNLCRVQEAIKKEEHKIKLEVPIIQNKIEERKENGLERENLSPEIRMPDAYAQWTGRRPPE